MNYPKFKNLKFILEIILIFLISLGIWGFFLLIREVISGNLYKGQPLELIVGCVTVGGLIVRIIRWHINTEIEREKNKMQEELRKSFDQKQEGMDAVYDFLERAAITLNNINIGGNSSLSKSEQDTFISLLSDLNILQTDAKYSQVVKEWLENKQKLISLSRESSNIALTTYPFNKLEMMLGFRNQTKAKHHLYQSIYNCLTWIKYSFNARIYLTSNLPTISDQKRTIAALNWIKTEVLPVELSENSAQELAIYFDKLSEIIIQL